MTHATLKIYGTHDEKTVAQMMRTLEHESAVSGVLCADGHLGYGHPIGGVVAYEDHISLSGVGFDIACGNAAVRLDVKKDKIADKIETIVSDIQKTISFGVGQKNKAKVDHALFDDEDAWKAAGTNNYKSDARNQLGTVGSGNHYVDLFCDDEEYVWIGVHFGSRGLGHKSASKYLKEAGGEDGYDAKPCIVPASSELGERYLAAMTLAGRYAYAGRDWVVERVRQIIGAGITDSIHNHHNFAWLEEHGGRKLWVVRKGATPAHPGERGFVGGSMGDDAVILSGVDAAESKSSLYSTIHGAGRVMSRTEAKGRYKSVAACTVDGCEFNMPYMDYEQERSKAGLRQGAQFSLCPKHKNSHLTNSMKKQKLRLPGKVRHDEMVKWIADRHVIVIGGGLDEAPQAYRRLPDVLKEHASTVAIEYVLHPFAVFMAGENEFDPFKD